MCGRGISNQRWNESCSVSVGSFSLQGWKREPCSQPLWYVGRENIQHFKMEKPTCTSHVCKGSRSHFWPLSNRIKLKLLRPLNPTNETRPILYSYHLTVLASEIVNSVYLSTFFEAFLWMLLIDERKTSIFWEKCFVEKYDWCGAKKGHPEPTIQLLFLLPSPNCFKSFFY